MPVSLAEGLAAELARQGVAPGEVQDLNLDGKVKATTVEGLEAYTSLQSLSLSCCGLRKFGQLPPSLTSLVVSDNQIAGGLDSLAPLTALKHLDIAGNRIRKLSQLEPLTQLKSLESLDTEGCPVEDSMPDYTKKTFEMLTVLPAFGYLNGMDKLGNERVADEEVDAEEEEEYEEEVEEQEGGEEEGGEGEEGGEEGAEEGGEEGGVGGGEAGGDEGGDDDDGAEDDGEEGPGEEEQEEEEEEEEEGTGTAELLRQEPLEEDEEDYEEEEEVESEEDEPAKKRKRGTREYGESDYEEEADDSDEDYDEEEDD